MRLLRAPVFVLAPPRSGGTLLFEALAQGPDVVTVGDESHELIEDVRPLAPADRDWSSNRLTAAEASAEVVEALSLRWWRELRDRTGRPVSSHAGTFVEKTPKNCLRVPFLAAAYPDARFVYVHRDPRETISSMLDGWLSQEFVTYPELPGWPDRWLWSFLLVPGWRELIGRPLAEIVANQWASCLDLLIPDLAAIDPARWHVVRFADLLADPPAELTRLRRRLGLADPARVPARLPWSRSVLTPPAPDKWQARAAELRVPLAGIRATVEAVHAALADRALADRAAADRALADRALADRAPADRAAADG